MGKRDLCLLIPVSRPYCLGESPAKDRLYDLMMFLSCVLPSLFQILDCSQGFSSLYYFFDSLCPQRLEVSLEVKEMTGRALPPKVELQPISPHPPMCLASSASAQWLLECPEPPKSVLGDFRTWPALKKCVVFLLNTLLLWENKVKTLGKEDEALGLGCFSHESKLKSTSPHYALWQRQQAPNIFQKRDCFQSTYIIFISIKYTVY